MSPIRVLIADDSPFVCRMLTTHLQAAPGIQVVGTALNGLRAVELVKQLQPDAVTLDLEMPELNGLEALKRIMRECPTPVIMLSGISREAAEVTLEAIELGAVDFILKYTPGVDTDPNVLRREIVSKVRSASKIKVIRSLTADAVAVRQRSQSRHPALHEAGPLTARPGLRDIVVIGASTGGPAALQELLEELPSDFSAPVLIVQHMPATFTGVLAAQLDRRVPLPVREARQGESLEPGTVYVTPGERHLLVNNDMTVELSNGPKIGGHRPSVDVTMQSVAQVCGSRTTGVLLTGMGEDGAAGMSLIHAKRGKTFAQNEDTCVVFGMPRRAIENRAVDHVASPKEIGELLRLHRQNKVAAERSTKSVLSTDPVSKSHLFAGRL